MVRGEAKRSENELIKEKKFCTTHNIVPSWHNHAHILYRKNAIELAYITYIDIYQPQGAAVSSHMGATSPDSAALGPPSHSHKLLVSGVRAEILLPPRQTSF